MILENKSCYIPYFVYKELKNKKYGINKKFKFDIKELDNGVIFFDENMKFIDPKQFEIENITPKYVLIPRFFWLSNMDELEEFICIDNSGNKYKFIDFIDNDIQKRYNTNKLQEIKIKLKIKEKNDSFTK